MACEYPKNREDHYLPQAYLRGFADPATPRLESRPLWVFDIKTRSWRKRSPAQIGWEEGFYDFVGRQGDREHAEEIFSELENGYPKLIQQLRATAFQNWREHSKFLLLYVQMIQCRSPLFRQQFMREWSDKQGARVVGFEGGNKVKVDSLKLRRFSPGALKEGALNAMKTQMKSGTAMLETFHWQIRLADSIRDSFVTSDHPLIAWTPEQRSFDHRATVMIFPLCWEACLLGKRDPLAMELTGSTLQERESIRQIYFASAQRFVASPDRLF